MHEHYLFMFICRKNSGPLILKHKPFTDSLNTDNDPRSRPLKYCWSVKRLLNHHGDMIYNACRVGQEQSPPGIHDAKGIFREVAER